VLAVLAGPVKAYTDAAAAQLASLSPYQQAVLGGTADTRRPYDARRPEAPAAKREKP
jgi:multicomponent K+:H+ antiporter subunit D